MSSKNRISFLISFVTLWSWAYAYDFKVPNADGYDLCYSISPAGNYVHLSRENDIASLNYKNLQCDTINIPPSVVYNDKAYTVTGIDPYALEGTSLKYVTISGDYKNFLLMGLIGSNIEGVIVPANNPFYRSEDGLVYTTSGKTLIYYPYSKKGSYYSLPEGVDTIAKFAFVGAKYLKTFELPLSLKVIEYGAFSADSLEQIICQDGISELRDGIFGSVPQLRHVVLGNNVKQADFGFIGYYRPVTVECRTKLPSSCTIPTETENLLNSKLLVPRQSVQLYMKADGWNKFGAILPIEPPIVEGVNEATVSWVQNFSATGYVWHLYSDEEHTQSVMTLYFDDRGYLTKLVLGDKPSLPQRMAMAGDESQEKKFAEYYSFTIDNLLPDTKYYYVRQSVSGDDVIDEENGTFTTKSHTPTSVGNSDGKTEDYSTPQKILENGKIHILHNGSKYTLDGKVAE